MANYATLKAAIQQVIKTNGNEEITGALLQQSLLAMINSLGGYYQFAGIAAPSTNPGTPDQNVYYIASTAGTYSNFNGITLANGEIAILKYNGTWSKDSTGAATQESVNQLRSEVDGVVTMTKGAYITSNQGIGNVCPLTQTAYNGTDCAVVELAKGQTINITGVGGNSSRLWAILDETTHKILEVAEASSSAPSSPFEKTITAEQDCIVVINVYNENATPAYGNNANTPYSVKLLGTLSDKVNATEKEVGKLSIGGWEIGSINYPDTTHNFIPNYSTTIVARMAAMSYKVPYAGTFRFSFKDGYQCIICSIGATVPSGWQSSPFDVLFNAGDIFRIAVRTNPATTVSDASALALASGIVVYSVNARQRALNDGLAYGRNIPFTRQAFLSKTTGSEIIESTYVATDFIPTKEGDVFYYSGLAGTNMACVNGYNGKTFISSLLDGTNRNITNQKVVIPSGVTAIRSCSNYSASHKLWGGTEISKMIGALIYDNYADDSVEDSPENLGVAYAIQKAVDMSKLSQYLRNSLAVPTDNKVAGDTIIGLPYSSTRKRSTFVPNNVSFETYLSALSDANSKAYMASGTGSGATEQLWYGEVCAPFAQYCLGIDVMRGTNWTIFTIPGMQKVSVQDAQHAKLGDIINVGTKTSAHCKVVVGVSRRRGDGMVTHITTAESISPLCVIEKITASAFNILLNNYTLLRYQYINQNKYDSAKGAFAQYEINRNIMPDFGNKANYGIDDEVNINILDLANYTGYVLEKDGKFGETVPLSVGETIIKLGALPFGKYALRLTDANGNMSPAVEWIVIDYSVMVTARSGGIIRFAFSSKNALPIGTYWSRADYMPTIVREIGPAELDAGYIDTQLSSDQIMVADDQRYENARSEVEKYGDLTEIYGRVLFKTEFGIFTSPQPQTPVEIIE